LPGVVVYCDALAARVRGKVCKVKLKNPFLLHTAVSLLAAVEGKRVRDMRRLGKPTVMSQLEAGTRPGRSCDPQSFFPRRTTSSPIVQLAACPWW